MTRENSGVHFVPATKTWFTKCVILGLLRPMQDEEGPDITFVSNHFKYLTTVIHGS